jgi:hypothetical protein
MASACQNFGRPSLTGIYGEVSVEVELRPWRLAGSENVGRQRVVVEAVQSVMGIQQSVMSDGELTSLARRLWHQPPAPNGRQEACCSETPSRRDRI